MVLSTVGSNGEFATIAWVVWCKDGCVSPVSLPSINCACGAAIKEVEQFPDLGSAIDYVSDLESGKKE